MTDPAEILAGSDGPPQPLTEAMSALNDAQARLKAMIEAHTEAEAALRLEITEHRRTVGYLSSDLDLAKIDAARKILYVRGCYTEGGDDRGGVVADAIQDLLNGKPRLRTTLLATKSFDRWHGQRSDHAYGYGPRHGTIVFGIGLWQQARDRDLTPDEIEAAIYFLTRLEAIEARDDAARLNTL